MTGLRATRSFRALRSWSIGLGAVLATASPSTPASADVWAGDATRVEERQFNNGDFSRSTQKATLVPAPSDSPSDQEWPFADWWGTFDYTFTAEARFGDCEGQGSITGRTQKWNSSSSQYDMIAVGISQSYASSRHPGSGEVQFYNTTGRTGAASLPWNLELKCSDGDIKSVYETWNTQPMEFDTGQSTTYSPMTGSQTRTFTTENGSGRVTETWNLHRCQFQANECRPLPPAGGTPVVSRYGLSTTTFRAASSGPSVARERPPIGTRVSFTLSEASTMTFTVMRVLPGRKRGNRCERPGRRNRNGRKCTRLVAKGTFNVVGTAGANGFRFTGRLKGKKLAPGSYKLVLRAKKAAGKQSKTLNRSFKIVP